MAHDSERARHFREAFNAPLGLPPGPDPVTDPAMYRAWHAEAVEGPVRRQQFLQQVAAARGHVERAAFHRVVGDLPAARRSLQRAATERVIATRMPRG